ncbi:hypothetical protein [Alkalicoccus halolimnae]|uniref:Uncharacterized protein n=1 Tax=Alkalicoccus halolimnae TaxID=1667239 RepID=A0A5C7FDX8_9BACI|nr:hypothetical protein [Alkalicoccus halolimnae]TXF83574.1 hypothetical protein FTX54_12140 [Alkalicoccus halolimnae]
MKIILLAAAVVIFLLPGCGGQEAETLEKEYDISGKNLGSLSQENVITVFVEDSEGGEEIKMIDVNGLDRRTYEVEAYQLLLTERTRVISNEGEKEVNLGDSGLEMNTTASIQVKTEEEFTREISSRRDNYILYDRDFLPVYHAEEIRVEPLDMDHFHHFVLSTLPPGYGSGYLILFVADRGSEEAKKFMKREEMSDEIKNYKESDRRIWVTFFPAEEMELFGQSEEFTEYPYYLIYNDEQFLAKEQQWEQVLEYFRSTYNQESSGASL